MKYLRQLVHTFAICVILATATGSSVADEKVKPDRDTLSIVLLQSQVSSLSKDVLVKKVNKAWGPANPSNDAKKGSATPSVSVTKLPSKNDRFVIKSGDHRFTLEMVNETYVEKSAIEAVVELRNRKMLLDHHGFIAISFAPEAAAGTSAKARKNLYRQMSRLLATLVNEDTLGVMIPAEEILACNTGSLSEQLQSEDPIAALREALEVPVVDASDDDPKMKEAVAEAHKTWAQFVAAFKKQAKNTESFGVKFPFDTPDKDRKEFMWVQVTKISDDLVMGTLANEPVLAQDIKLGDKVQKKVSEMSDWMYYKDGEIVGGFSVKVLMEQQAARESGDAKASGDN